MIDSHIRWERGDDGIVTLTLDWPGPVNLIDDAFLPSLTTTLDRLERERDETRGVILASAKQTFFAGADLRNLIKLGPADATRLFAEAESVKRQLRRLETLGRPVVALIEGSALAGGWELCLACHHRVAVDDDRIQLGVPEVTLGLLPGAGGVTRLVRMLGLQAAFPYLVEGKLLGPRDAQGAGFVTIAADGASARSAAREWISANPSPKQPWDRDDYRMPGGDPSKPAVAQMLAVAPAMLAEKTKRAYPAPEAILSAMVEGAQVPFDAATRIESRWFVHLATGQIAKNMIGTFFFAMEEVKKGASRPRDIPRSTVRKVGILGAGMMGAGIAWANASRGIPCVLEDVSLEKAERGKSYSAKIAAARVEKKRLSQADADALLARIQPADSPSALEGCDLIIEAVFEKAELKASITRDAEPFLAPNGIFASNTSTLPITSLATASAHPERFIGLHFFSPVDKMRLVEIIKGQRTNAETLARAYDYVGQLGKIPIVVNDSRGFYTSRVFGTYIGEGVAMLGEGIAPAAIEHAAEQIGMPTPPLAIYDEVTMSLSLHVIAEARAAAEREGRAYEPPPSLPVLERMVNDFERPGRAAGGGFYEYPAGGLEAFAPNGHVAFDLDEMKDRLLYIQAIESVRCLNERVVEHARDANVGSIFGIGFPAWTGGALQFVRHVGAERFLARSAELAAKHGRRFDVEPVRDTVLQLTAVS